MVVCGLPNVEVRSKCIGDEPCAAAHALCGAAMADASAQRREHHLTRGEQITVKSNGAMRLSTVHSGLAALCATLPDGRRQIVFLATPGDPLLLCEQLRSACWIEALAPTVICEIDLPQSHRSLHHHPTLLDALLAANQERLAVAAERVITLGRTDGTERVTDFLADMTRRLGRREGAHWRVHLPLSREDIADYLGLNAETVSRILGRIKRARLVLFSSPTDFEVPDLERLASRSPLHGVRLGRVNGDNGHRS